MNGGPRSVSDATRLRVLKAVEELGYRPNAVARALRSASSRVLGLIVPDITNPFFAELALAIERRAFQRGYSLFLGNAMHEDEQQAGYLRAFSDHQVRGVLIIGATAGPRGMFPPATKAALAAQNMALVFLDRVPRGTNGVMLRVDNTRGAYEATRHLAVDHGHRSIACISGPESASSARDRDRGWSRALTEAGIDPKKQLRGRAEFDRYSAFEVARGMFGARKRPTAIFVHSDEQAIGVLHAASTDEVRIPHDLAVVSFDGIRESALTHPPLTTVQQPLELAAERALDLLIEGIDKGQVSAKTETLPVTLIVRESCGCGEERVTPRRSARKVAQPA
jgi:LacI family transcriptional regulator